jgi:hypothetical protein
MDTAFQTGMLGLQGSVVRCFHELLSFSKTRTLDRPGLDRLDRARSKPA